MGFTEVLTLIFITLKLTGYIDWSWWLVLLPEIIAISIAICFIVFFAAFQPSYSVYRKRRK